MTGSTILTGGAYVVAGFSFALAGGALAAGLFCAWEVLMAGLNGRVEDADIGAPEGDLTPRFIPDHIASDANKNRGEHQ